MLRLHRCQVIVIANRGNLVQPIFNSSIRVTVTARRALHTPHLRSNKSRAPHSDHSLEVKGKVSVTESHRRVIGESSESHEEVIGNSSRSHRKVIRQSSGNQRKIQRASERHWKIIVCALRFPPRQYQTRRLGAIAGIGTSSNSH